MPFYIEPEDIELSSRVYLRYNSAKMFLYRILSTLIFVTLLPLYFAVRVINGKYLYGWREKLGFVKKREPGKAIMLHGVSVGEIIALENLAKKIKETFPQYKIIITTGTQTGQEIAQKKYAEIADFITYFPFDVPFCVNSFLDKVHPSVILIAETEIWPNFANACHKRNIPLYTINGRISDSTYKIYKFLTPFFKSVFRNYAGILTQSEEDCQKFVAIGAPPDKTKVMKNLKFDIDKQSFSIPALLPSCPPALLIAGSTHSGEDEIILDAFSQLKKKYNDIKLLLAPRHLKRIEAVSELVKKTGLGFGLRSNGLDFEKNDIVILDTLGELSKMYAVCEFAFIGGSFNNTGGHNPLEAVIFNKPVVSGPSIHNFKDIYGVLGKTAAGKVVKNPQELTEYMDKLLSDKDFYTKACADCEAVFEDQRGAIQCVIEAIR